MSGFISSPLGNAALAPPGENAPTASYPASVWDSQDWFGLSKQVARGIGAGQAMYGTVDEFGRPASEPEPYTDAATLNQKYGIPDQLHFDNALPESVAESMHQAKRDELARADAAARSDAGTLARLGAGFVAGAADPLNIAAGFLPVVSEARVAGALARAGLEGGLGASLATRALTGAAGAFTGQVPLTALRYGLSQQEQADYSASDAMMDILMGTALGGGLHTAIGGGLDIIGSRFARSAVARLVSDEPAAREAAARAAVAQMAQDQPVDLRPVLDSTVLRSAYAERLAARGETAAGNYAAFAPDGTRVELTPQVVEASSLIASHNDDGSVNLAYPHAEGLQGRDRSSLASQEQIGKIAAQLNPELLGASPDAAAGAPIVNQDGAVESGNGRLTALRRVYADPQFANQAAAYRAFLEAQGHDISGMTAPVLIGRRVNEMTPEAVRSYTRSANERATLGMSAAETARADADRAGRAVDSYQPGPLSGSGNREFIARFMAQLAPEERGGMMLANGDLSTAGEARIRQALLAHAYGDSLGPVLEKMLNGDVEHMKGAAGALGDVAGMWSKLRAAAAAGEIPAGLDITPAIGEAMQLLDRARSSGTPLASLLAQSDMIGGPSRDQRAPGATPAAAGLLRLMFQDDAMRRPVARAKLAALLEHYVQQALEAKPGPGLFGEAETTPADIMRVVARGEPWDGRAMGRAERFRQHDSVEGTPVTARGKGSANTPVLGERPSQRGDARGEAAASGLETAPTEVNPDRTVRTDEPTETPAPAETPPAEASRGERVSDTTTEEPATEPPDTSRGERVSDTSRGERVSDTTRGERVSDTTQPSLFGDDEPAAATDQAQPAATVPAELTAQIANLQREFADLDAAGRLDPAVASELAAIAADHEQAQSVLGAISQAATCLLGGLA